MAQGIYSQATKRVLDELEEQKKNLEIDLFKAEVKNPFLTREQILFALYNYRKLDLTTTEGRQRLIDSFVNSIYLFDDHFVITYNYKNQSKTVSFDEINSSSLTSKGSPKRVWGAMKLLPIPFFAIHNTNQNPLVFRSAKYSSMCAQNPLIKTIPQRT